MAYQLTRVKADRIIENIKSGISRYFKENGLVYAVFGKSEGLDSSVIAGLLSRIKNVRPIGVIMPCESDVESERLAKVVLDHFGIPYVTVDLTKEFHALMGNYYSLKSVNGQLSHILKDHYHDPALVQSIPHKKNRASGNIKARLRMVTLYHIALLTGGIVISTDNLSEWWMGYWTINGDVGDLAPIQNVWKGMEEPAIARALGVPQEALNVVPTDGLNIETDEDQLGLPYKELDRVIVALLQNKFDGKKKWSDARMGTLCAKLSSHLGHPIEKIAHTAQQMTQTNFKRDWPIVISRLELGLPDIKDVNVSMK